jgi:hypothetical protein
MLPLERDLSFSERNALEVYEGASKGQRFEDGGEMDDDEGVDLFEDYEDQPEEVSAILSKYELEDNDYNTLNDLLAELNEIGYTFEFGLDAEPYDLRKIGQKGKSEFYAKGGIVVTKISNIPNFKQRLADGKITYRGLGMGKISNDFYNLAGEHGTRIKVDGKEYYITDTEFDSFSRGADGKLIIRFDAPYRKSYAEGGELKGDELENVRKVAKNVSKNSKEPIYVIEDKQYNYITQKPDFQYTWATQEDYEYMKEHIYPNIYISVKVKMRYENGELKSANEEVLFKNENYAEGGKLDESTKMVLSQNKAIAHHTEELKRALQKDPNVEPWVIGKVGRAETDISDVTHYLDGRSEYARGGVMKKRKMTLYESKLMAEKGKRVLVSHDAQQFYTIEEGVLYKTDDDLNHQEEFDMDKIDLTILPMESYGGKYAKGGFTPNIVSKNNRKFGTTMYYERFEDAIGSFAWMYEGKYNEGILYPLSDFDKKYYSHLKLKDGEVLLRYKTERMIPSSGKYLIKINIDKGLVYFLNDSTDDDDKNPIFDSRGTKLGFLSIDEIFYDLDMYAKGGLTFDEKVKAVEKSLMSREVPKKYRNSYGKTYNKSEAHESAQKIIGAQIKKYNKK